MMMRNPGNLTKPDSSCTIQRGIRLRPRQYPQSYFILVCRTIDGHDLAGNFRKASSPQIPLSPMLRLPVPNPDNLPAASAKDDTRSVSHGCPLSECTEADGSLRLRGHTFEFSRHLSLQAVRGNTPRLQNVRKEKRNASPQTDAVNCFRQ
jgi:hypothetical protein